MDKQIFFGTDGIRGRATQFPFTQEGLARIGNAIGRWATKKYKRTRPRLLIAADTRESGHRIKQDIINSLSNFPLDIVDAFILPTPAVCQIICSGDEFDCGIVISASHNPYYDNGIKLFDGKTCKLSANDESVILSYMNDDAYYDTSVAVGLGTVALWKEADDAYYDTLKRYFTPDFLQGLVIVVDCAHGATSFIARRIFDYFGARVISVADEPNGVNINDRCGALYPDHLKQAVLAHQADIGFAFDGDGDRIICVNKNGETKDGDDILFLLSQHLRYQASSSIVGTIMSNSGLEDFLVSQGKTLIRTNVGDKYVVAALEKDGLLLGGESSGHIVLKDYLATGDGIFVALRLLETMQHQKNWDFKTFDKKPQVLLNVSISRRDDLTIEPYKTIIMRHEQMLQKGRVLVRFSGTEDVLRVMIEDRALEHAQHVAKELASSLSLALQQSSPTMGV